MRIAQIAPLYEAVPPKLYGGTERVVAALCDELCMLGHDVVLFASGDSHSRARLVQVRQQALRLDGGTLKSDVAAHLNMLHEVRRRAREFDVLHFHTEALHFPFFEAYAGRTVTTLHGRLDIADVRSMLVRWPEFGLASISDAQRTPVPCANWLGTVLHGLPADSYRPPAAPKRSYLAFLGRISPEKRPEVAIQLAKQAQVPLKIAAKVDHQDREYFETVVKPLLEDPLIEFVGEIADRDKADFLGNALALVFPILWPEPFGLVIIEAFACGTPVIAWNCGSVPEIVEDGVTGFVVDSEAEALRAIGRAKHLSADRILRVFQQRFTAHTMAQAYIRIYKELIDPTVVCDGAISAVQ